jgi:DNA-binding response OmpR family regulator
MRRTFAQESVAVPARHTQAGAAQQARGNQPLGVGTYGGGPARPREVYDKGRLRIDFDAYEVCVDGQEIRLLLREFEILRFFVRSPNRVYSREQILDLVWGRNAGIGPRTVDVHIRRLRMRIERDAAHPELIVTTRGVGYKFADRALVPAPAEPRAGERGSGH